MVKGVFQLRNLGTGAQKNMECQIRSHCRWILYNEVVLGPDQEAAGLVLRPWGIILAICDDFIWKSMPKISFLKKKFFIFVKKWSKSRVDFGPILLEDFRVVLAPKWPNFTISKDFWWCFLPKKNWERTFEFKRLKNGF